MSIMNEDRQEYQDTLVLSHLCAAPRGAEYQCHQGHLPTPACAPNIPVHLSTHLHLASCFSGSANRVSLFVVRVAPFSVVNSSVALSRCCLMDSPVTNTFFFLIVSYFRGMSSLRDHFPRSEAGCRGVAVER
jgi:hypothetical protein